MNKFKEFFSHLKNDKKVVAGLVVFFLIVVVFAASIFFIKKDLLVKLGLAPKYVQAFILVNDKISEGADIVVNVPAVTTLEKLQGNVSFVPEIKGDWVDKGDKRIMVFRPAVSLVLGNHYTVVASTTAGLMKKDFLVVEKPQVVSVFPNSEEANEESEITIIFNRPMVSLTNLSVLTNENVPVEITPATKGKFKWIGTKTLQFKPETTLIPSANYKVKVKADFVSVDGLRINEFEQVFVTRPLRYENISESLQSGVIVANKPFIVRFNQAIDLSKTSAELILKSSSTGELIPFTAEYATKEIYNEQTNRGGQVVDESVLLIYQKQDKYSRDKKWDFKKDYELIINKAFPKNGDINLAEKQDIHFTASDVIEGMTLTSPRSQVSDFDVFDPTGTLDIAFYEDIDLLKSKITSDKIDKIKYGEKCKNADEKINEMPDCEKIDDKSKIIVSFSAQKINKGESIKVNLEKIINNEGLLINPELIMKELKSFSDLRITKTIPNKNTGFVICSNNPLLQLVGPDINRKNINKYIVSNLEYEIINWNSSYRVNEAQYKEFKECNVGDYQTNLELRFMPEADYRLTFNLTDEFGQNNEVQARFKSGKLPDKSLLFFHYQPKYNMTTPTKTKLVYATQNMEFVDVNICKLDPQDMLYQLDAGIDYWKGSSVIKNCVESVDKRISLPKKYWVKNYLKLDLKDYVSNPLGHYLLTFTNPGYKDSEKRQVYERTYLTVTNLSVVEKSVQVNNYKEENNNYKLTEDQIKKTKNIYWVIDLRNFAPVNKASVEFFGKKEDGENMTLLGNSTTGANGIAEALPVNRMIGSVIRSGDDSAIVQNSENDLGSFAGSAQNAQMMYLYTDRPIYRPGQMVYFRGIYRVGFDGDYEVFKQKKIPVKVFDAGNKEIYNKELAVSDFGTFNGEFVLPKDTTLGEFRIEAKQDGYAYFSVEEYVGSAFKLDAKSNKDEYLSGEKFNLDINASYYFGAPVDGGTVEYSIVSQDYYFDKYKDEYFDFGSGWYSCPNCGYGDHFISRNQTTLDSNGKANINQEINIGKLFKLEEQKSKIIVVYITVKNGNGQAVSMQKSFVYHAGQYYLGLNTDKSFFGKNEKFNLKMKSVDVNGKPVGVDGVKLKLSKLNWTYNKRQEVDGAFYYQWEKKMETVTEKTISTDNNGSWGDSFSFDKEGEYEAEVIGTDGNGNNIRSAYGLYVYGEGQVDVRPNNDTSLEVITDKNNLKAGEQAKIIIKSPFMKAKALISIERGRVYDYRIVDVNQNIFEYTFPVVEKYTPSVYASVVLLSPDPEVKFGNVNFNIDTDVKKLIITSKLNKDVYLPGEEVILNINARDAQGRATATEISAAVVDMSVLALKGNPKKDPISYFYNYFPLTVMTASNIKNVLFESDVYIGGKGGGGMEPEDLAKKKRGVFKDTAFWQADIRTNNNGDAQVKFTLPDNLTTWQLESLGVSTDTKLGVDYKEFMARKEVMVVPLKPRFVLPGDQFSVGAQVFNQSKEGQDLEVSFISETLTGSDKFKVSLKAGETRNIYFSTSIAGNATVGEYKFTVSAHNEKYNDTVESTLQVNSNNTYETVATADNTNANSAYEYVYIPDGVISDKGGLTVNTSATLALYSQEAINYLLSYPYGCSEQIASKLKAIAIAKKAADLKKTTLPQVDYNGIKYSAQEAVNLGLKDLYANYNPGRGFSYYPGGQENIYLTMSVVDAMISVKESGLENDDSKLLLAELSGVIQNSLVNNDFGYIEDNTISALGFNILSKLTKYKEIDPKIINRIRDLEKDKKFLNEEAGNLTLLNLAEGLSMNPKLFDKKYKDEIYKILESRIKIDSRGAFLPADKNINWQYYENSQKNTAQFLKVMTTDKRENKILGEAVRWLLKSRDRNGIWESTNNTLAVVEAFNNYTIWQGENKSDFTLDISVNNDKKAQIIHNDNTPYKEEYTFFMSMNEFAPNYLNVLNFAKTNNNQERNNFYYDVSLKYYIPAENLPPLDEGFYIDRGFYMRDDKNNETKINEAKVGDVLRGHLEIIVPKDRHYVAIEDYIPAGVELINFNLSTADQSLNQMTDENIRKDANGNPIPELEIKKVAEIIYPNKIERRDDRLFMFVENLSPGKYIYDYYVRVLIPGKFLHMPAMVSEMYFPENFGRTSAGYFEVKK